MATTIQRSMNRDTSSEEPVFPTVGRWFFPWWFDLSHLITTFVPMGMRSKKSLAFFSPMRMQPWEAG